jgi:integrase
LAALTDAKAKAIKPGDRKIADGTVKGLWLDPTATKGCGYWFLRYTSPVTKTRRQMGLGTYPEVSIAAVRDTAQAQRRVLALGKDPLDERNEKRAKETMADFSTFEGAARKFHQEKKPGWKNGKHVEQWISSLEAYVFPKIGSRKVETLTVGDFAEVLKPIWNEMPETAGRVKQRCENVMKWCWAHGLITANPLTVVAIALPLQTKKEQRVQAQPSVPWKDLPRLVQDILHDGKVGTCREIIEATILTAARSGEIRGMKWDEIDFENKIWVVPADRMKNKKVHRVPLSWRMMEILQTQRLKGLHPELVFPSPTGKVLSDATMTKFLRDHKVASDTPGRPATVHGFRSTIRTWGTDHGYDRDLLEKSLAHTEKNQLVKVYTRTDLLEMRRPFMEDWANYVTGRQRKSMTIIGIEQSNTQAVG